MIQLNKSAVDRAIPLVAVGLKKYCEIQSALGTTNVVNNPQFQKRFNAFYRVRRATDWRLAFFALLQQEKTHPRQYIEVLRSLFEATGRIEASFASKLVATVDTEKPVIDSVVLNNVGLRLPTSGLATERMLKVEAIYNKLKSCFATFLDTETGRYLVRQFEHAYPKHRITKIKMLDLVLWQTRPTKAINTAVPAIPNFPN